MRCTLLLAMRPRPLVFLLSATLALPTLLTGCGLKGSGVEATEKRELETFNAISIDGGFILIAHVDPATTQRVEVRGDDNIVPEVVTTVTDGTLELTIDQWLVRPKINTTIEVWVPNCRYGFTTNFRFSLIDGLYSSSAWLRSTACSSSVCASTRP